MNKTPMNVNGGLRGITRREHAATVARNRAASMNAMHAVHAASARAIPTDWDGIAESCLTHDAERFHAMRGGAR